MSAPMIHVRQLVKNHGSRCVLNGVEMQVVAGEVAAIIGPSGGGKSTLLRCINGLEIFQAGSISVEDVILKPDTSPRSSAETLVHLRRKVGMVFQQFNLFPHKNVLENVAIGPRLVLKWENGRAIDTAFKLLDRVGLRDKAHARPEQLSGGEQQRVAIARTLAVQPRAILFDEPTSALDPRMANEVLAVITDLAQDGLTMVVVTHAMNFARKVATTVHVMHDGRVAESGPSDRVFSFSASPITQRFLHEVDK
jgi:polar amino acid transport system ATP-binding protein